MAPPPSLRGLFGACGAVSQKAALPGSLALVPRESLFVSEPNPEWFGNEGNEEGRNEHWSCENWLRSRFHFSFAEYHDGPPSFGVLQVMNDDLVQPMRGFGAHPHRDMEIITFVVEGELTHKDSMGEEETLSRGSVQFMSAGSGVRHSEHNWHEAKPLRFIQSWVVPRRRGLAPNYGSAPGDAAAALARRDRWAHLVSDVKGKVKTPVQINQDCNVFVTELSAGTSPGALEVAAGRQIYALCIEGDVSEANGAASLRRHDAFKAKGLVSLAWTAGGEGAMLLVFEMALSDD